MDLQEFMWERHNAFTIEFGNEKIVPGSLLEVKYETINAWEVIRKIFSIGWYSGSMPTLVRIDGNIWDLLSEVQENDYESELVEGNLVQEKIKHSTMLKLAASLPQYGINFSGSLENDYKVVIRVGKIQARVFKNTGMLYKGTQSLLTLKNTDENLWEWINGDYFVSETYYTTQLRFNFYSDTKFAAKADFQKAGFKESGDLNAEWSSDNTLILTGAPSVPFAARGIVI